MTTFRRLALLLVCTLATLPLPAQQTRAFVFAGGVVWTGGGSYELAWAQGVEPAQVVWSGDESIVHAAVAGNRLVLSNGSSLLVFASGSWTPQVTKLGEERWGVALAAGADTALAFDSAGGVWRLDKAGAWSRRESGIADEVLALAHNRGRWVAVGATPAEEVDDEDVGPANYGTTSWMREGRQSRAWWSDDGANWQPAALPADNQAGKLLAVAGGPRGWLAVNVNGSVLVSPDGKTWQAGESSERFVQEETKEALALGGDFWVKFGYDTGWQRTADGRTWERLPLAPEADRAALFMKDGRVHAVGMRKAGRAYEVAVVEDFAVVPGPDAAELAALKAAEEKALAEKQEAEAKAAADRKATEEKARVEKQARDLKRQAIAASLTDLSGVFHGTANGIHWDGGRLLVSAQGGIYRSTDGAKFELWIPYDRIGFQGLREAGGRLWTWSGSPNEGRSDLMGFPPNAGGKQPVYQTAAGRITGIAGEGASLAFITDAGNGCYVYASDDGGDRWSFSPVKAGDLLPMQYGYLPNMVGPGLAYGNGRWVAVGRRADNTTAAAVSTDRVNWKMVPIGGPKGGMMRVVFVNGRFVASGQKDLTPNAPWVIASSPDGEIWELATLPGESPGLVDVASGRLYAHNRTGLFTSEDARTWRRVAAHAPLDAVTVGEIGGRIVLVGEPVTEGRAQAPQYQLVQVSLPQAGDLAIVPDIATQNLVAALEKFDATVLSTKTPAEIGRPLGELIAALDRLAPGAIPDAVAEVAAEDMPAYGGVRGTFDLMMSLPGPRVGSLNRRLTDDQREMIKVFATAHNARLYNRPVDTRAVAAAEATWPAGEYADGFRGPQQSGELDLARVRVAAFTGNRGAMSDLSLIYSNGAGAPKHGTLGNFWGKVHRRLDPAMPPASAGQEAQQRHLAATGSPYFAGRAALLELEKTDGRLTDELLARLKSAARDGMMLAQEALDDLQDDIRQRREGGLSFAQIYAAKPASATAADWFNAANRLDAAAAKLAPSSARGETTRPPPPAASAPPVPPLELVVTKWKMPERLAPLCAALAEFEQNYNQAVTPVERARAAAGLITALDGKLPAGLAGSLLSATSEFMIQQAGLEGFQAYRAGLPSALHPRATLAVPVAKRPLLIRAGLEGKNGFLPDELRQAWPAQPRALSTSQGRGTLFLDQVRARLLEGDGGAALDLSWEYHNGWGLPTDADLSAFYQIIAGKLEPRLNAPPAANEATLELFITAGSAQARYIRAIQLLPKDAKLLPAGRGRTLLEEAAALGHATAALQVGINRVEEMRAQAGASDEPVVTREDQEEAFGPAPAAPGR